MKINIENIPKEFIEVDQWVCWAGIKKDNGKISKIPKDPKTGKSAKTNDSSTWGSFDEALNHYKQNNRQGIGFVFSQNDPFVGIDLDDCLNPVTENIEPWAEDIINRFNSYTEITPSGKGFHILLKGKLPGSGRKVGKLEIYDQGRFFTVTGNHLETTPFHIMLRQEELTEFYEEKFDDPSPPDDFLPPASSGLDLQSIITKALSAKNGEKFRQLWEGNYHGYPSQSEADLALCKMLSYWTENNPHSIDLLFRQSGLYRPKWDQRTHGNGMTYGEATIQKALSDGLIFNKQTEIKANKPAKPFNLTDLGNAERLVSLFGDDIRYCHAWREWLIWDGCR